VRRGLLIFACFTPTDASHVLSRFTEFDGEAAHLGAQLLARQKTASGDKIAETVADIAQMSLDTLSLQSAISLLDASFAEQGEDENIVSSSAFLTSSLKQRQQGDAHSNAAARTSLTLELPLIALGASASAYYPDIADLLGAEIIIPPFSEVAGAVGAAAGSVRQRVMILVTQPRDGVFRVHLPDGLEDKTVLEDALNRAREAAKSLAKARAVAAGAKQPSLTLEEKIDQIALTEEKSLFLQAAITADAAGTPS
jgi:N-methylhydantoinase A/oxoprolinase/acetone carboxylase beta subunit